MRSIFALILDPAYHRNFFSHSDLNGSNWGRQLKRGPKNSLGRVDLTHELRAASQHPTVYVAGNYVGHWDVKSLCMTATMAGELVLGRPSNLGLNQACLAWMQL
jgi:hypothetical protein